MVATLSSYTDIHNHALPGSGYDGVVRVSTLDAYGSGVLLHDGRTVLTAAHLLYGTPARQVTVYFETEEEEKAIGASKIKIYPSYDSLYSNGDIALVWLEETAPVDAERYSLYRSMDEVSQQFTMVGYGIPGTGNKGVDLHYDGKPVRLQAENRFGAVAETVDKSLSESYYWNPLPESVVVADFDNGDREYDALGYLLGVSDTGTIAEGMITPGDSGGPAFIDGKVAGIASYIGVYADQDYDAVPNNSSFGELGFWQRTTYFQQWIDQKIREQYSNAPLYKSDVETEIVEHDDSVQYAYFWLEFTGERDDPEEWLSVDYATRDGTALAGEDYLPVADTLILYPGENQAVIPVEILGDIIPEEREYFSMVLTNPVGGSFGEGIEELIAIRTIIDNDAGLWL